MLSALLIIAESISLAKSLTTDLSSSIVEGWVVKTWFMEWPQIPQSKMAQELHQTSILYRLLPLRSIHESCLQDSACYNWWAWVRSWADYMGGMGTPLRLFRKVMKSQNLRFWLQFSAKYMGILGSLIFSIIILYEYRVNLNFLRNGLT